MRTSVEIRQHLSTLTQALYFKGVHREELTEEGRVQLRSLEENISLLKWCLQAPDPREITWKVVREAYTASFSLLKMWLFKRPDTSSSEPGGSPDSTRQVTR